MSACGTRIAHDDSPKTRTDSAMTHREAGGLSTVIDPAASDAPYRNAVQDFEPACAAAA
jgi:hypothetical protein